VGDASHPLDLASHLADPRDTTWSSIDVLRITGGAIAEIVTFHNDRFPRLGLPESLPADSTGQSR